MAETRSQDWTDWLESISQQDLYITNKYITSCTIVDGLPGIAKDNTSKATALAESFFPPLLQSLTSLLTTHIPRLAKAFTSSREQEFDKLFAR